MRTSPQKQNLLDLTTRFDITLFCFVLFLLKPVPPVIYPSKENPVDTAVVKGRVLNTKQ